MHTLYISSDTTPSRHPQSDCHTVIQCITPLTYQPDTPSHIHIHCTSLQTPHQPDAPVTYTHTVHLLRHHTIQTTPARQSGNHTEYNSSDTPTRHTQSHTHTLYISSDTTPSRHPQSDSQAVYTIHLHQTPPSRLPQPLCQPLYTSSDNRHSDIPNHTIKLCTPLQTPDTQTPPFI